MFELSIKTCIKFQGRECRTFREAAIWKKPKIVNIRRLLICIAEWDFIESPGHQLIYELCVES